MVAKNFNKRETAQSMVEFAISAIVILMLLVAIADLGRAFFTYLSIRDAAQEGAVYGAVCPLDLTKIENRIRLTSITPVDLRDEDHVVIECTYEYRVNGVLYTPNCGTTVPDVYPLPGQGIRVRVTYNNFTVTTPLAGSLLGQTLTLRAEVTDTIIRVPPTNELTCQ
jgi:hypothetical protein